MKWLDLGSSTTASSVGVQEYVSLNTIIIVLIIIIRIIIIAMP